MAETGDLLENAPEINRKQTETVKLGPDEAASINFGTEISPRSSRILNPPKTDVACDATVNAEASVGADLPTHCCTKSVTNMNSYDFTLKKIEELKLAVRTKSSSEINHRNLENGLEQMLKMIYDSRIGDEGDKVPTKEHKFNG